MASSGRGAPSGVWGAGRREGVVQGVDKTPAEAQVAAAQGLWPLAISASTQRPAPVTSSSRASQGLCFAADAPTAFSAGLGMRHVVQRRHPGLWGGGGTPGPGLGPGGVSPVEQGHEVDSP